MSTRPTGSHSKDVQTLLRFYNHWADEIADDDSDDNAELAASVETGQAGGAQGVAGGGGSGSKCGLVKAMAFGGLFLGQACAAMASPTPMSSRTVFAMGASFIHISSSPVWGYRLITQPKSQNVTEGEELVLKAAFADFIRDQNTAHWTRGNVNFGGRRITTNTNISDSGTVQSVLTINPVERNDGGDYRFVVTNVQLDFIAASTSVAEIRVLEVPKKEYPICTIWPQEYRAMDIVNLICISENLSREEDPALSFSQEIGMGMWSTLSDHATGNNNTHIWISKTLMAGRFGRHFSCRQQHVNLDVDRTCQVFLQGNDSVALNAQPVTPAVTPVVSDGVSITPRLNCDNTLLEAQLKQEEARLKTERVKIGAYCTSIIVSSCILGGVFCLIYKRYERHHQHPDSVAVPVEPDASTAVELEPLSGTA